MKANGHDKVNVCGLIRKALEEGPGTARDISTELQMPYKTISALMVILKVRGHVKEWGSVKQMQRGGNAAIYDLTDRGRRYQDYLGSLGRAAKLP